MVWTVRLGRLVLWILKGIPLWNPGLGFLRALFVIPNHRDPKPLLEVDDFGYPQFAWIFKTVFVFFFLFSTRRFVGSNFARKDHLDAFVCGADLTDVDLRPAP